MHGTIARIAPADKLGLIRTEDGREYVFGPSAVAGTPFDDLREGSSVEFDIQAPAGGDEQPRAIDVRITRRPRRRVHPRAGDASGAGTGEPIGMIPPPGVDGDVVAEASWQSFPASDPPAWGR